MERMTGWDEWTWSEYGIRVFYVNGIPIRYERIRESQ